LLPILASGVSFVILQFSGLQRQCLDGLAEPEILVENHLSSIEGMALDWVSNVLYFVDGIQAKIEIISTNVSYEGRMRKTILGPEILKKPRGIAVHPVRG
jgi:hypothetical protein